MSQKSKVLVLVGTAEFGDRWHDLQATGACLADVARKELPDADVEVRSDVDAALAQLDAVDLLIVNVSDAAMDREPGVRRLSPRALASLSSYVVAGRPVLAMHAAAFAFPDSPAFVEALGVRWRDGRSWHPPYGPGEAYPTAAGSVHPAIGDGGTLAFVDERYTDLEISPTIVPLLVHDEGGRRHPLITLGPSGKALYCALGHDPEAFDNDALRSLLGRAIRWLIDPRVPVRSRPTGVA